MLILNIFITTYNYSQSIIDNIVIARHQFYYLSYFLFLSVLKNDEDIDQLMEFLTILSYISLIVSAINYFHGTIFYHPKWSAGTGERSGIVRAFLPGMDILCLTFFWQFHNIIYREHHHSLTKINSIVLFLGILFRQTRGRIIAVVIPSILLLITKKQYRLIAASLSLMVCFSIAMKYFLPENILLGSFESVYTDIREGEGTWRGRISIARDGIDLIKRYPITGSGSFLLRDSTNNSLSSQLRSDSNKSDLGYLQFIKNYGFIGLLWIIFVIAAYYLVIVRSIRKIGHSYILSFAAYYFISILISMITMNYLYYPNRILVVCLLLSIVSKKQFDMDVNNQWR